MLAFIGYNNNNSKQRSFRSGPMINYARIVANVTQLRDKPKNILEIGSRDGKDAEKLRSLFKISPDKVYIVEPNPDQVPKINENFPQATLFDFAVSNKIGTATFNKVKPECDEGFIGTSSLMERPEFYQDRTEKIEVDVKTGEYLLEQIKEDQIDLCKIDVEGHTFEVLESFGEKIHRINTFHIESEHVAKWHGQKLYAVNKAYLESMGYTQIMFMYVWGGTIQSDSVWAKNTILKGRT